MAKPKQEFIKGMAPVQHTDIEKAADHYDEAKCSRIAMLETEVDAKAALIAVMNKHQMKQYKRGEYQITMDTTETIKCKIGAEKEADE